MRKLFLITAVVLSTAAANTDRITCIQSASSKAEAWKCFSTTAHKRGGEITPSELFYQAMVHLFIEEPDQAQGIQALTLSATFNDPLALEMLAGFYLHGKFVEKNEATALALYSRAAHLGYGPAQFNCGIMYKNGQGTACDPVRAYIYLDAAAHNRQDLDHLAQDAAHYRTEVEQILTDAQKQQAQQMRGMLVHGGHS